MAKKGMYCVRDSKAEYYMAPFLAINDATAKRNIQAAMQSDNDVSKFPEDHSLWKLGEYDDATGKIEARDAPTHLANCVELVQEK
jgi:hypothetical protein